MNIQIAIQIRHHIESNQLYEAKTLLSMDKTKLELNNFCYLYLSAKLEIYSGNYLKASQILNHPACRFHLESLADLCLCYFQMGLMESFIPSLLELREKFEDQKQNLTETEKLNLIVLISKFYEEIGEADLALELLGTPFKDAYSLKTLAIQKLRVLVSLGKVREARTLYKLVIAGTQHDQNFEIEREHALLLTDNFLFGVDTAMERYQYLTGLNLTPTDRSFLYSEMVEVLIVAGQAHKVIYLSPPEEFSSDYERYLKSLVYKFILNQNLPTPLISQYEKNLSPTSLVRMIRLYSILNPQSSTTVEQKFQFHLSNIPSKGLREQLAKLPERQIDTNIYVNFQHKTLRFNNSEFSFKNKMFWKLGDALSILATHKELSMEEAVRLIYDEVESPQHYDRLRMAIYRLNKELSLTIGCKDVFSISKKGIGIIIPIQVNSK